MSEWYPGKTLEDRAIEQAEDHRLAGLRVDLIMALETLHDALENYRNGMPIAESSKSVIGELSEAITQLGDML